MYILSKTKFEHISYAEIYKLAYLTRLYYTLEKHAELRNEIY